MRALITGGAGFIGSHLAERLLDIGHNVMVIDDLSTGSIANIAHLKGRPGFEHVIDSIMSRGLLAELVDEVDLIFHLAAAVGVHLIVESPVKTLHTNVRGTDLVLEMATKKRKKVIVASTSEVYGKSNKVPFSEDDDLVIGPPVFGRWSYACSKAMDEFLALSYHRERRLPVVIVRFFNTVGPRQVGTYGMVLPRFVQAALSGSPIRIYGDGQQSRCFGWVGDVVNAIIRLAELKEAEGRIFNIGSDEEVTIKELAAVVKSVTDSDSPIVHMSYEEAYGKNFEDMRRRVPDLSRIRSAIGYAPSKTLTDIVQAVVDHFKACQERDLIIAELVPAD